MKKRVFSGIQPTGDIHIGNYLAAIRHWVKMQDTFDNIFCIVDMHAITVQQDPKVLKAKIREVTGLLLAAGIDPKRSIVFVQSDIGAHTELAAITGRDYGKDAHAWRHWLAKAKDSIKPCPLPERLDG